MTDIYSNVPTEAKVKWKSRDTESEELKGEEYLKAEELGAVASTISHLQGCAMSVSTRKTVKQ